MEENKPKKEFARGMKAGAICLTILVLAVFIGGIITVLELISSCNTTYGFEARRFFPALLTFLTFALLIVYGLFSFKKGTPVFIVTICMLILIMIFGGIVFPYQYQNNWAYPLTATFSAISALCFILLLPFLMKRKKAICLMFTGIFFEVLITVFNFIFVKFDGDIKAFDAFLNYAYLLIPLLLTISVVVSHFLMAAKKQTIDY